MIPGINSDKDRIIAATGAGGKTSFLQHLARLLKQSGRKVLLTTTTRIYHPDIDGFSDTADRVITARDARVLYNSPPEAASITVAGMLCENPRKLSGIPADLPAELIKHQLYDNILIEADGSRHHPLKAPADNEPVLPEGCQVMIGVTGWKGIDAPVTDNTVHRLEQFRNITGLGINERINHTAVSALINSPEGLFKQVQSNPEKNNLNLKTCKRIWCLNQLDTQEQRQQGRTLALAVMAGSPSIYTTILSSFSQPEPWLDSINTPSLSGCNNDQ
ncbi:hypothetical protein GZ77_13635 [Endozoicomonas montiporae]|uniref:Selenium-dependent hydroxylase accessory protein YqeC n=2 Tax=Endozoicomonas montiporae TaxID=1027273 RepID=A0A081N4P7_9GAMM|nr:selenium cofactor biosynthesis protein YqeC [Endozoicomonas montiporae]AMO57701.1 hypothetical protein EZMO1_3748 [Endozoicomonas montiporae CL-33]KEQ13420.1 hypothetical protein GZ77_13635 [Endozoicomonas montiporae]